MGINIQTNEFEIESKCENLKFGIETKQNTELASSTQSSLIFNKNSNNKKLTFIKSIS